MFFAYCFWSYILFFSQENSKRCRASLELDYLRSELFLSSSSLAIANESVLRLTDEMESLRSSVKSMVGFDTIAVWRANICALSDEIDSLFVCCGNHFASSESRFRELIFLVRNAFHRRETICEGPIIDGKFSRFDSDLQSKLSVEQENMKLVAEIERLNTDLKGMVPLDHLKEVEAILAEVKAQQVLDNKAAAAAREELFLVSAEVDEVFAFLARLFSGLDVKFKELVWSVHMALSLKNSNRISAADEKSPLSVYARGPGAVENRWLSQVSLKSKLADMVEPSSVSSLAASHHTGIKISERHSAKKKIVTSTSKQSTTNRVCIPITEVTSKFVNAGEERRVLNMARESTANWTSSVSIAPQGDPNLKIEWNGPGEWHDLTQSGRGTFFV